MYTYIDRWDKYEREKEELTTENIIKDLKQYYQSYIRNFIISIVLCPILSLLIYYVAIWFIKRILYYNPGPVFSIIFWGIFCILLLLTMIDGISTIITGFSSIKKGIFQVSYDVVVEKLPKKYGGKYSSYRPYTLIFEQDGSYRIPDEMNYKWSLLFPSTDEDVYESASLGDEFYLISIGKQKNIIAYNQKHFELKE